MFAEFGDALTLTARDALTIDVSGPFGAGVPTDRRNLVWQAAEAAGWSGHIALGKNLPHAAGIGGGSSDAAAVLRSVSGGADHVNLDLALQLGADVPVCVRGQATRMRGIGETLTSVNVPPLPVLLINPGALVLTGEVFGGLANSENPPMPEDIPEFDGVEMFTDWLSQQRNDLEGPAQSAAPVIAQVLDVLRGSRDVLLARMSGSGATCFAVYPTLKAAQLAAYEIEAAHPDWWYAATVLK